jgi:hypothetical protein
MPLHVSVARLKKTLPQAAHIFRQGNLIQHCSDLIHVQGANIFKPSMRKYLLNIPAPLEGIRQVNLVRAPNNIQGRVQDGQSQQIDCLIYLILHLLHAPGRRFEQQPYQHSLCVWMGVGKQGGHFNDYNAGLR